MKNIFSSKIENFEKNQIRMIKDYISNIKVSNQYSYQFLEENIYLKFKIDNLVFDLNEAKFDFKPEKVSEQLLINVDHRNDNEFGVIKCAFDILNGNSDLMFYRPKDLNINIFILGNISKNKAYIQLETNISDTDLRYEEDKKRYVIQKNILINYLNDGKSKMDNTVENLNLVILENIKDLLIQKNIELDGILEREKILNS